MNSAVRTVAAHILDRAMRTAGVSNTELAKLCDVAESRVRRWRSDDEGDLEAQPPITVLLVHDRLTVATLAEIKATRDPSGSDVTKAAMRLMAANNRSDGSLLRSLADGSITPSEYPEIEQELTTQEHEIGTLRAAMANGRRR